MTMTADYDENDFWHRKNHDEWQRIQEKMKVVIDIKETPRGDVELNISAVETIGATQKEGAYAYAIKGLLSRNAGALGKSMGAAGTISGSGNPANS